eukprot:84290_1
MSERQPNFPISPDLLNELAEGGREHFGRPIRRRNFSFASGPSQSGHGSHSPPSAQPSGIDDSGELDDSEELAEERGASHEDEYLRSLGLDQQQKKDATKARIFDFRFGKIPDGISFVGESPTLQQQADGSTVLDVPAGTYLKAELSGLKPNGGEKINDFTLTMDVKFSTIPVDGVSLFQTSFPEPGHTDEAYMYPTGGVGIFSECGNEALLKVGQWNRVVITMGHGTGETRAMGTYINGKRCATICKGVFERPDGRFSVDPRGFLLFASERAELAPGLAVRYVELLAQTRSPEAVKEASHANSVFSQWKLQQAQEHRSVFSQLSLSGLYTHSPPIWNDSAFLAHFGDAFIENTGLAGGTPYNGLRVLALTVARSLGEQRAWLEPEFGAVELATCEKVKTVLEDAVALFRKFVLAMRGGAQLVAFLRHFRKLLEALKPGSFMLIPGGWVKKAPHFVIFVLEKLENSFRLAVCNTGLGNEYHPVSAIFPPKIKYKNTIVIDDIAPDRILDDAWWAMVFKLIVYKSKLNGPERLYDYLLPFLTKKPLEASIFETDMDDCMDWRSPQLAKTDYYRSILEAFHYMHRRLGLSSGQLKTIHFNLRRQYVKMLVHDLHTVPSVTESDMRLVRMGCQQLAYSAVKHAKRGLLSAERLGEIHKTINAVELRLTSMPSEVSSSSKLPPQLDLDTGKNDRTQWWLHSFFDRLPRKDDTDGLAGAPVIFPKFVPINTMLVPERSNNFEDALAGIRWCDKLCTLISVQSHTVKNGALLKCALIEHTFTQVVPVPAGKNSPDHSTCLWAQPLRYALQLDILILLQRIIEHFASSAFSLRATRSFDAVRIVVPGCMAAIADAVMRKAATDIPSEVCLHLMGGVDGCAEAFGIGPGCFGEQSETIEVTSAELNVARTAVLDYFSDLEIDQSREIFCWEKSQQAEASSMQFCATICQTLAFDQSDVMLYVSGEKHLIVKNYPEFACYRDVAFYWKYFMATDPKAFPPVIDWQQKSAELKWTFEEGQYIVRAYRRFPLFCKADGHRWPSAATPSKYTFPSKVLTEDDVLHIRNLPTFDDVMGARDSELLLSYLTVPYIRLPLVLSFFATEDRIHTLRSEDLRNILNSIMFEPGRYLPASLPREPTHVPTTDPRLLATPYGLLLNELHRSPSGVFQSMFDLLRFALNLDTGTVHSTTVRIILFVVLLAARFDNSAHFLISHARGRHSCLSAALRDVRVSDAVLEVLEEGLAKLRTIMRGPVHTMLEAWCAEALSECKESLEREEVVDENTKIACNLHAHLFLIYRNVPYEELSSKIVSTFLSSFIFLSTRHTWNMKALSVPETELFEAWQVQRRSVVKWMHAAARPQLSAIVEGAVRVTAGTGMRIASSTDLIRGWGYISGDRSIGRFTVAESAAKALENVNPSDVVETVSDHEHGVEVNLQTAQLTLKTSHLKALDRHIAQHPDCVEVFGIQSMQCAVIESAKNREWVRLVGRHHDIAFWKTPDDRMALQVNDRDYEPGFLPPSEQWIIPLFEPVRLAYFTQPVEVQFCLPEATLSSDANVAYLVAIHPKAGGTWKEVFVFKHQRMVHIYSVLSHGRRFYRSLDYTTDARFALREMQPPTGNRRGPWPRWGRYAAGDPIRPSHSDPTSVVISREKVLPSNLSGTEEMFVPSRLLFGLVPSALLSTHRFWQDGSDNIRGYPLDKSDHIIFVELNEVERSLTTSAPEVCARVTRRSRKFDEERREYLLRNEENEKQDAMDTEPDFAMPKDEVLLLDLVSAPVGTPLFALGRLLSRIEKLSYILAWTRKSKARQFGDEYWIDLVELPRLKMTFAAKIYNDGTTRLYSVDHSNLFVTNKRTELTSHLVRGIPHSLILANANQEPFILVPSIHPVRPFIMSAPFSTELVMNRANFQWLAALDTRYYLYPVHISLSFLHTPTLASALYLMLLRFLYRDYNDVFRLVNSIATDTEFSEEEALIFETFGAANGDAHPNAHACRAKISLVTLDSPVVVPWDLATELGKYTAKLAHVSAPCRLGDAEILQLLEVCDETFAKEAIIRKGYQTFDEAKLKKILKSIFDPVASAEETLADKKERDEFFNMLKEMIEKELSITASRDEILAILLRVVQNQTLTQYFRCLLKNRHSFLEAKLNGHDNAKVYTPEKAGHSNWILHRDHSALGASPKDWQGLSLNHAPPRALSGHIALGMAHKLWPGVEDLHGNAFHMGFLFLYEMFTGTIKVRICSEDDSHSFASLLSYLYHDMTDPGLLTSILNICLHNPTLCAVMPKFKDNRQMKLEKFNSWRDDEEPNSPLDDLLSQVLSFLATYGPNLHWPDSPSDFAELLPPPETVDIPEYVIRQARADADGEEIIADRSSLIPAITNFACSQRALTPLTLHPGGGITKEEARLLSVDAETLANFSGRPLEPIRVNEFVTNLNRTDRHLQPLPGVLPFDVTAHPCAQSKVAQDMVSRLKADAKIHASLQNTGIAPRLTGFLEADVRGFVDGSRRAELKAAIKNMKDLLGRLDALREKDTRYVTNAIPTIVRLTNHVDIESLSGENSMERLAFLLMRYSGQETKMWLGYLVGSLLSSKSRFDWIKLNPYIPADTQSKLMELIVYTLMHANRAGVANRALNDVRELLKLLNQCLTKTECKKALSDADINLLTGTIQRSESLAVNLVAERYFIDKGDGISYDPRFLVFEFTWNILLRQQQVLLVREFMESIRSGNSLVKQMIMGAGKTTVVAPLLALMLADGKSLVLQVVPRALLEFSRSVMRSTFSSIMHKRIYTLNFDRAVQIGPKLHKKLSNAISTSGVVISTPTAVKSLMLKFLENLDMIDDETRPRHKDMEKDSAMLSEVVRLFQDGVLLMDEVDLILHPLKSELNFPIGAKHDLDFHPLRWTLPIHMLDAIFFAERARMSVGFRESTRAKGILERLRVVIERGYESRELQESPHIVLLNPEFYHTEMKPIVAEWVHLWLEAQHVSEISEEQIMAYILEGAEEGTELWSDVNGKLSPKHKKMLNLSRDWLRSFLPHILQKIDRVSFGILSKADLVNAIRMDPHMPRTRAKLGVPFVGKDVPSRSSEFAHPDIIIGLSILAYRYEGLRYTDFTDIIASLRATLVKEVGPYSERASSRRHASWTVEAGGRIRGVPHYKSLEEETEEEKEGERSDGEEDVAMDTGEEEDENIVEVVPLRLLKQSNDDQMLKLFNLIRKLPDCIHWYLTEFIFPAYMRHQTTKLSACGQEIGGDMLFGRRLGFSGTPSDLLPEELGRCGYEKGTDGLMVATLTDPDVVNYSLIEPHWSVKSILDRIATADPPFHALIDTGALVTGMSNLQVARYLLDHGLNGFEGIVFLDDLDRKMILVRATGRILKLAQCGIELQKRFAFYDQVHTTGMDIKHVSNATAVLTVGKDMTFRDYSQGAFRMRGIGKGQTIHLFIIPEVDQLIYRELKAANVKAYDAKDLRQFLVNVSAWLVVNSMRLERIQFNQLCLQNVTNVWRKNAFRTVLAGYHSFRLSEHAPPSVRRALDVFRETIDFSLEAAVPVPRLFSETIGMKVDEHKEFILNKEERGVVAKVQHIVQGLFTGDDEESAYSAEMVQQQEEEKEKQQEQEQEQEIEIEKYVDLAYSREQEEPTPWLFTTLKEQSLPEQFYPAKEFKLYKREPVRFPDYIHVSNNYFDKRWSGARRLKNVIMVMEVVPSLGKLCKMISTTPEIEDTANLVDSQKMERRLSTGTNTALQSAFGLFDSARSGALSEVDLRKAIRSAVDFWPSDEQIVQIVSEFGAASGRIGFSELKDILLSEQFRAEEKGRRFIVVSLAEAETIRRIMHMRLERDIIDGHDSAIALHCIPAGDLVTDVSFRCQPAPRYQSETAHQAVRYLDCDMYYKDPQLNILLKAMQRSSTQERQLFFELTIGCRRRMRRKWEETPLAKLFSLRTEFHLLKQRAQSVRMREAIEEKGILLYDAFRIFDSDRNGLLSAAELYGALDWLGIQLEPIDVLEFVASTDSDGDGNISYSDFVSMLRDPDASVEDLDEETGAAAAGGAAASALLARKPLEMERVQPKGEAVLQELQERLNLETKHLQEADLARQAREEERIQAEIEHEEKERDMALGIAPNPSVSDGEIRYDFSTGHLPKRLSARGYIEYQPGEDGKQFLKVEKLSYLELDIPFTPNGNEKCLNMYTVTVEVLVEHPPATWQSLFMCRKSKQMKHHQGEVTIQHDGGLGCLGTFSNTGGSTLSPNQWYLVTVSVNCADKEMLIYVNGVIQTRVQNPELSVDGQFSIDPEFGLALFGSAKSAEMRGGCAKFVLVHPRVLMPEEVINIFGAHQAEGVWSCDACTMRNEPSAIRCALCNKERPNVGGMRAAGGAWSCPVCTFHNRTNFESCEVCDTSRPT